MYNVKPPTAIALPAWTFDDLKNHLSSATKSFVCVEFDQLNSYSIPKVFVESWDIDGTMKHDFNIGLKITVQFQDDYHEFPAKHTDSLHVPFFQEKEKMTISILLEGMDRFSVDYQDMNVYQVFQVVATPYGNGTKRDYKRILLKLLDEIRSKRMAD